MKILSIVITFVILFTLIPVSFAGDNTNFEQNISHFNEYDAIKNLSEYRNEALLNMGYSSDDINKIKNYKDSYFSHIINLNKLNDESLFAHGYDINQISMIRNFK